MICPECGSEWLVKNGKAKNRQRYKCKDCGKTFYPDQQPNAIYASTRLRNAFIKQMLDEKKVSITDFKTETRAREHKQTLYYWRHKVLCELVKTQDDLILSGQIQADEIFFPVSYKGNQKKGNFQLPRPAHQRSSDNHIKGISKEKVAVLTAMDDKGVVIAIPVSQGKPTSNDIYNALKNHIKEGSTLITDSASSYNKLAKQLKLNLIKIPSGRHATVVNGIGYNIQKINNLHKFMRKFMGNFFGVSSKFLPYYVAWYAFIKRKDITQQQKKDTLTKIIKDTDLKSNKQINKLDRINIPKDTKRKKKAK